ncbi:hypothetical protein LTR12_015874 [Friedmanniomyces endolithicus]|nr:hypothetical protein LTR12_015874 [Friedmanniomyces endolithicus]
MNPHTPPRVLGSPFKSPPPRSRPLPPPLPSPPLPSSFSLLHTAVTSPLRTTTDLTAFREAVEYHHATNVPRLPDVVPNIDPALLALDDLSYVPRLPEAVTNIDPAFFALDNPSYAPKLPNKIPDIETALLTLDFPSRVPRLPEAVTNIDPALLALDNRSSHARAVTLTIDSHILFGTLHLISGYEYYVDHYPRFFDSWPSDSIGFDDVPSGEVMTMVHSVQGVSWGRSWDFPPWIAIVTEAEAKAEVEKKVRERAERNEVLEGRETAISRLADGFLAVTDDRGAWQDARDLGTCSFDGVFLPSSPMFGNFILAFHSGNLLELSQLH